jgi:hypothetical protein
MLVLRIMTFSQTVANAPEFRRAETFRPYEADDGACVSSSDQNSLVTAVLTDALLLFGARSGWAASTVTWLWTSPATRGITVNSTVQLSSLASCSSVHEK